MRYQFRSADGTTCCENDDVTRLCSACQAQARTQSPTTASRMLRVASSRDDDAVPPPPDMNAQIRAATTKRHVPASRAFAPTTEQRLAALNANMRIVAPPEDLPPAMRAASRRAYDVAHDVPPPISNAEFNRRISERAQ